jgi:hypothetical protein
MRMIIFPVKKVINYNVFEMLAKPGAPLLLKGMLHEHH